MDRSALTELLFIRHGLTDWNLQQRFQGQTDTPLNAEGHAQAAKLAARLAAEPLDALISSDLRRARETAAPLATAWRQPVLALPGLREQHFGLMEGLDAPAIEARHPELWQRWLEQDADFAMPGAESTREFHARVMATVRELVAMGAGRRLAVVTHGGVLDMLWRSAHGLPLGGQRACEIPNTGLNRLRWAAGALHIEQWGDASHLVGHDTGAAALAAKKP